jgi:hypothetical protein
VFAAKRQLVYNSRERREKQELFSGFFDYLPRLRRGEIWAEQQRG